MLAGFYLSCGALALKGRNAHPPTPDKEVTSIPDHARNDLSECLGKCIQPECNSLGLLSSLVQCLEIDQIALELVVPPAFALLFFFDDNIQKFLSVLFRDTLSLFSSYPTVSFSFC